MSWEKDLENAPSDPNAAARVLEHAATFMLRGEALPTRLGKYIGEALADAARQETNSRRAEILVNNLHLKARDGRPEVLPAADVVWVDYVFGDDDHPSETRFVKAYAARHQVSESVVWTRLRKYKEDQRTATREFEAFMRDPYDPL